MNRLHYRLYVYQNERFPLLKNGLLIAVFTFSSISYSRTIAALEGMSRPDGTGFIPIGHFVVGAITAIVCFLFLRIADEFKDAEEDALYRPYRAVPRGLVSLRELAWLGGILGVGVLALNAIVLPRMVPALLAVLAYTALMSREFFVRRWLKAHPMVYMVSHMIFMPMMDLYTTGLDWIQGASSIGPPAGLGYFLAVSFFNGMIIEVGRKIRAKDQEEHGVETYSALYGQRNATLAWLGLLLVSAVLAALAALRMEAFGYVLLALASMFVVLGLPGVIFLRSGSGAHAKLIDVASGVWVLVMYLVLGLFR